MPCRREKATSPEEGHRSLGVAPPFPGVPSPASNVAPKIPVIAVSVPPNSYRLALATTSFTKTPESMVKPTKPDRERYGLLDLMFVSEWVSPVLQVLEAVSL